MGALTPHGRVSCCHDFPGMPFLPLTAVIRGAELADGAEVRAAAEEQPGEERGAAGAHQGGQEQLVALAPRCVRSRACVRTVETKN